MARAPNVPPFRYAMVERDVYRSAQPTLKNYRFLSRLKLRSIISLVPEPPLQDQQDFCHHHGIDIIHVQAPKWKEEEGITLTQAQVAKVLSLLIQPGSRPALLHCLSGVELTGTVVMCLRKLQCWVVRSLLEEARRFLEAGRTLDRSLETTFDGMEKFMQDFNEEVVIGPQVPSWLWSGNRAHHHPSIKVRHEPPLEDLDESSAMATMTWRDEMERDTLKQARSDNISWRRAQMTKLTQAVFKEQAVGSDLLVAPPRSSPERIVPEAADVSFSTSITDIKAALPYKPKGLSKTLHALALEGLELTPQDREPPR
ncbi:unnamed protein product [Chrysoparadoxa australica]